MGKQSGFVFNIQHLTVHDGPGIRTEVFLKGCPLHCRWCSNPEGIDPRPQLGIYPDKCLGKDKCGFCLTACPKQGAPLEFTEDGIIIGSNDQCLRCMSCAKACFVHAIKAWGEVMSVDDVMREVLADEAYYGRSGGGITLNGGEVTVQADFALSILEACRDQGIHTCVETTMFCSPEVIERFYPLTDLFLVDVKLMDPERHKRWTGVTNEQILSNIRKTAAAGVPMILRTPVVPGINDDDENMQATAAFIKELGPSVIQYQLLQYRKLGTEKYASIGQPYPMPEGFDPGERKDREQALHELAARLSATGIPAVVGANARIELSFK